MLWAVLVNRHRSPAASEPPGLSESRNMSDIRFTSSVALIAFAIGPAILLLSIGEFSLWFYPGSLAIIMAGVVRLAYVNVYSAEENDAYAGIPLEYTPLVVSALFLFQNALDHDVFAANLYGIIVILALLHVGPIGAPKSGSYMSYVVTGYVIALTLIYSVILWSR